MKGNFRDLRFRCFIDTNERRVGFYKKFGKHADGIDN